MMVVLPFIIVGHWGKDEWVEMLSMSLESCSCFGSSTRRGRRGAYGLARTVACEPLVLRSGRVWFAVTLHRARVEVTTESRKIRLLLLGRWLTYSACHSLFRLFSRHSCIFGAAACAAWRPMAGSPEPNVAVRPVVRLVR